MTIPLHDRDHMVAFSERSDHAEPLGNSARFHNAVFA